MRVIEKLRQGQTFSVEVEPPDLGKNIDALEKMLDPLVDLGISFIDVTYHREKIVEFATIDGGVIPIVQKKKPGTAGVAGSLKARYRSAGVEPVPHVLCFTPQITEEFLVELCFLKIENVLVVRGDVDKDTWSPYPVLCHKHASDVIRQIAGLKKGKYVGAKEGYAMNFCVGAACYPEKHPESLTWEHELQMLKFKVDQGADYLVTQLFYDNARYVSFVERARAAGIHVPIIPGLFPLPSYKSLQAVIERFGCAIPVVLKEQCEKYRADPVSLRQIGIEWCVSQCKELQAYGVPGLHFYAMRNAPVKEVLKGLVG